MARLRGTSGRSFGALLREDLLAAKGEILFRSATLARAVLEGDVALPEADAEGNLQADLLVKAGKVVAIAAPGQLPAGDAQVVDLKKRMVWPCCCEPHAHLFKSHACPRCPNPTGAMNDSRCCEASDRPWSYEDLSRRMEFTLKTALAHGTRFIRTHLDGTEDDRPEQREAAWKTFDTLRKEFRGAVELQGVANLFLPLWSSPAHRDRQLPQVLARRPHVILGAYCGIIREDMYDEAVGNFRALFAIALEHNLPVDLHIDETNDERARGLLAAMTVLQEVRSRGYTAPVLCGHSCALSIVPADVLNATMDGMLKSSGVVVSAHPPTNLWLQDRRGQDESVGLPIPEEVPRTPLWRGMTACHQLQAAGIDVAIGGDNVRDWWHNYGDADALDNLRLGVYAAHLDKPHGSLANWAGSISKVPAKAFGPEFLEAAGPLGLAVGMPSDFIIFNARSFSELLSRPQSDRVVVRSLGEEICIVSSELPEYSELDDLVSKPTTVVRSKVLHKSSNDAKMGY